MTQLRAYLLGTPSIELNDSSVNLKRRKDLALLAYLAVTSQTHTRESLAALFWPEYDNSRAFSNLRRSIWELKQIVGQELLEVEGDTVALWQGPEVWTDVAEFQSHLSVLQGPEPLTPVPDTLIDAVDLYQGDFMSGFNLPDCPGFDEWQYFKRDELRRDFGTALEKLAAEFGEIGNYERAIHFAQRWLYLDLLNEAPHRMLMTLYTWSGERAAAIRQYQECVHVLEEELGLTPEEDTTRLFERIQSGELGKKHLSEDILLAPVSNLPIPPTPFIGRRLELDQLHEYLVDLDCRLLTLLGPGGIGKTRLAIQAAEESLEKFSDGVYFVALAGLDSPQAILPAMARALNFALSAESESLQDQVLNYLRQKSLLFVLDNFEHLIAGAVIIGDIIAQAKGVKILTTSREKLGLQGEWIYEVSGMGFPEEAEFLEEVMEGYSAVQLFVQSAHRVQSNFQLTLENLPPVVRIAQLVRGMPLALELAAAWIPVLSCEEIAGEIERSLDFLETSMQDVPERQRSIRAVFNHSWRLLSERERESFAQLSVFRGDFTLQAARDIFGISPLALREMVGKSLLGRTPTGRYTLHELLRQYAAEMLAQDPKKHEQAHDLHSAYFCAMMLEWKQTIFATQDQAAIIDVINTDFDNALAAWNWALENQQMDRLYQAVETLALFYWRRARLAEGISLFSKAIHVLRDCSTPRGRHLLARLLAWEGTFHRFQRNFDTAEKRFLEALSILEDPAIDLDATKEDRALAHWGLGEIAFQIGDPEKSQAGYKISLKLFQESDKQYYEAEVLWDLAGLTAYLIWDADLAESYWKTALEIKKSFGDQTSVAGILYERATIAAYHLGNIEKATFLYQESSEIYMQAGDRVSTAYATRCIAEIAHLTARFSDSLELWQKQLPIFEELGNRTNIAWIHNNLGLTYKSLGSYDQAEAHYREALNILEANPEEDIQKGILRWSLGNVLLVEGRLSEAKEAYEVVLKRPRVKIAKHSLGRDLSALSMTEFLLDDRKSAWLHIQEAIELFLQYQHYDWMIYAASTLAVLFADRGEVEKALNLYGLITLYPEAGASQWFKDAYWCHVLKAAEGMEEGRIKEMIAHGRELDIWEYSKEILGESKSRSY